MEKNYLSPRICFVLTVLMLAPSLRAQSFNGVVAGSADTPITLAGQILCPDKTQLYDSAYWDFGADATPARAATACTNLDGANLEIDFSQNVIYSTIGEKKFTLTLVKSGGTPITTQYSIRIYDCSLPAIPQNAIVINTDTTISYNAQDIAKSYWVNPTAKLTLMSLYGQGDSTVSIFAEPGAMIGGNLNFCEIYLKSGAVLNRQTGATNSVIYGDGASFDTASATFRLECPTLDFDYTNAPPNPARSSSVKKEEVNATSISLSPNPTNGLLRITGLPSQLVTVSAFNVLGEMVLAQKYSSSKSCTLDLSGLRSGTYYIRFASANSVVTKKVVRE